MNWIKLQLFVFMIATFAFVFAAHANPDPIHIRIEADGSVSVTPAGETGRNQVHPFYTKIKESPEGNQAASIFCTKDVRNVQWAVIHAADGTTVWLKHDPNDPEKSFYFGGPYLQTTKASGHYGPSDADFVGIFRNINISGEGTRDARIKIIGGFGAFRIYDEKKILIRNIWFVNPLFSALIVSCGNVTIMENKITDTIGEWVYPISDFPGPFCFPILVGETNWIYKAVSSNCPLSRDIVPEFPGQPLPPTDEYAIYMNDYLRAKKSIGTVAIIDNEIASLTDPVINLQLCSGIAILNVFSEKNKGKSILIDVNKIRNIPDLPIFAAGGSGAKIWIEKNEIRGFLDAGPGERLKSGIAVFNHFYDESGSVNINNNKIYGISGLGIWAGGLNNSIIKNNLIELSLSGTPSAFDSAGIWLDNCPTGLIIESNRIRGEGIYGIGLWDAPSRNILEKNDLTECKTAALQIGLGVNQPSMNEIASNAIGECEKFFFADDRMSIKPIAGILIDGKDNRIINNDYSRSGLPGWKSLKKIGCVLLDDETIGNYVAESKFPSGTNLCDQILHLPLESHEKYGGVISDSILGYSNCASNQDIIQAVQAEKVVQGRIKKQLTLSYKTQKKLQGCGYCLRRYSKKCVIPKTN